MFSLRGVTVVLGATKVLDRVDLTVEAGERVAVIGPSGAGKTTLLSLLNSTRLPTEGEIRILGTDPAVARAGDLRRLRGRVGTIHQQSHLVGPLRVVHNVNAGRLHRWTLARALFSLAWPRDLAEARHHLARVGLAGRLDQRTDRLSGGEQQRVALARVLVQGPAAVVADEPVASLDPARAEEVMALLAGLVAEGGTTLVVSLHAFELALTHCERVVGLRGGRVLFDLPTEEMTPERAAALYQIERLSAPARKRPHGC